MGNIHYLFYKHLWVDLCKLKEKKSTKFTRCCCGILSIGFYNLHRLGEPTTEKGWYENAEWIVPKCMVNDIGNNEPVNYNLLYDPVN